MFNNPIQDSLKHTGVYTWRLITAQLLEISDINLVSSVIELRLRMTCRRDRVPAEMAKMAKKWLKMPKNG